jgi:ornithine cyclodeaminase/alanine dehydrogenase-like protein (mu-crystallin family)
MTEAVDALEAVFKLAGDVIVPPRSYIELHNGTLLLMPAADSAGAGVKLVTVNPANPPRGLPLINGVYVLFAAKTLQPVAVIDGAALTGLRTAAVSGLVTRFLARPDAHRLVIFGAGVQATAHLEAMTAVRPIESVTVVSRTHARAETLADRARAQGLTARVGEPDAVAGADIVCTCTTATEPLFDGSLLTPGAHINAVGAFEPHTRELDDVTVGRARIVVEERGAALTEAGDVLIPIESGHISKDQIVADLRETVAGATVRTDVTDITLFKSVGLALEDLAVATVAVAGIREGSPDRIAR